MIRILARPLALVVVLAGTTFPALASDGGVPEASQSAVREKLVAQGYDVRAIKMEDGMIEVYATRDGQRHEIYFDSSLNIVKDKLAD